MNNKGFTLIEHIMMATVVSILFVLSIYLFTKFENYNKPSSSISEKPNDKRLILVDKFMFGGYEYQIVKDLKDSTEYLLGHGICKMGR